MIRTAWECNGCKVKNKLNRCSFVAIAAGAGKKPLICPMSFNLDRCCNWRKVSECELQNEPEVQHARE